MLSMAGAGAPTGPLDANELEEVPSGKGYESLDEDDAPPRGNQLLEDEELVGLEEYAPEQEPSVDAGAVQAAAPIQPLQVKFALPPGAQPGAKLSIKVPDGRMLAFTVPVNAQPGMEFKLQYQPLLARAATAAPGVQGGPPAPFTSSTPKGPQAATGAGEVHRRLSAAKQRAHADDSKWTAWDVNSNPMVFGRPDFRPFKPHAAPQGFVADPSMDKGGPRPGATYTPNTHPATFVAAMGFDKHMFEQLESATVEYAAHHGCGKKTNWHEYKPFDCAEIMSGCGLLLRAGVSPTPQMELLFRDPDSHFIWGDERAKKSFPGPTTP